MIQTSIANLELRDDRRWSEQLRRLNIVLFGLLPVLLLFWRGGADAAVSIIGISYLAVLISRRRWDIALHPLLLSLLVIWLVLNLLVSPFAVSPSASFSRSLVWLRFGLLFAAAMTWLFQSRGDLKLAVGMWAATIAFTIVDGLVQLVNGVSLTGNPITTTMRLTGPLDRPNIGMFVARIGIPLLPAALFLLAPPVRNRAIVAIALLAGIGLAFILLTGERAAALLSLLAVMTAACGSILAFPRYRLHGVVMVGGIVAVLAAVVASSERIADRVNQFQAVITNFSASHYGELFGVGLDMWQQHPLFGVGMKNFQAVCNAEFLPRMSDGCPQHPHNVYIEWLAESGVVGLAAYLAFFILLILAAWPLLRGRTRTRCIGLLVAGCLALLFFPFTASQSIFSNWPALLFWSGLSLTYAVARLALKDDH